MGTLATERKGDTKMYRLNPDVVIRTCLDRAFYINIRTNVVIATNTKVQKYLEAELERGLCKDELQMNTNGFGEIVLFFKENKILEVV